MKLYFKRAIKKTGMIVDMLKNERLYSVYLLVAFNDIFKVISVWV